MDEIIKLEHVGMRFNLSKEKVDSVKEYLLTEEIEILQERVFH